MEDLFIEEEATTAFDAYQRDIHLLFDNEKQRLYQMTEVELQAVPAMYQHGNGYDSKPSSSWLQTTATTAPIQHQAFNGGNAEPSHYPTPALHQQSTNPLAEAHRTDSHTSHHHVPQVPPLQHTNSSSSSHPMPAFHNTHSNQPIHHSTIPPPSQRSEERRCRERV
eukprot:TRINITY_DN30899_c0_g1_i1.p1 TRINITY_DN30899_c0_g1~~TRINITY_DN30899_c0_g1_i1.p1  ORF type:complete len:176 (+),score=22.63 TRINITY_DN30899_c0_g1_i1:33-530(+)